MNMACNNINFKEIKEGYKETIRLFCRQLMDEDDDFKRQR